MLKDLLSSVSQKMLIDFNGITSQISHGGEKGTARENLLQDFLRNYFPEKFCFSKGIIVDSQDTQSKQVDIIIHDRFITPCLIDMENTKVLPIESVYAVIEVKSRLTKGELEKSIKNVESVRALHKKTITNFSCPTAGLIFAYDSDTSIDAIYKNLIELSQSVDIGNQISCICILNKGVILPVNKNGMQQIDLFPSTETVYAISRNSENSLLIFYLILTQILNSLTIFPPDMVAYAQSSEILDTSLYIPTENLPEDGTINVMNTQMTIAEIQKMQSDGRKFLSGTIQKSEFLECMFNAIIPQTLSLLNSLDNEDTFGFSFFDIKIDIKSIIKGYSIFQKGAGASEEEKRFLKGLEEMMYSIYDKHRPEMIKENLQST